MKILLILLILFGCKQKERLNGSYGSELLNTQTLYEFDRNVVTVKVIVSGIIVLNEKGYYEINHDEITFTFPNIIDKYDLEGSFTFKENDNSIMIGPFEFKKK